MGSDTGGKGSGGVVVIAARVRGVGPHGQRPIGIMATDCGLVPLSCCDFIYSQTLDSWGRIQRAAMAETNRDGCRMLTGQ